MNIMTIPAAKLASDDAVKKLRQELRKRILEYSDEDMIKKERETQGGFEDERAKVRIGGISAQISFINRINEFQILLDKINPYDLFDENGKFLLLKPYLNKYDLLKPAYSEREFDSFYFWDGLGGYPYILLKDENINIKKEIDKIFDSYSRDNHWAAVDNAKEFLNKYIAWQSVYPSDEPMGYLQLLHFKQFGSNFAHEWHACGMKGYVIVSHKQIEEAYHVLTSNSRFSYSQVQWEILMNYKDDDIEPVIEFDDYTCTIQWIEYYTHSGVYRCVYRISRTDFQIENISNKLICAVTPLFMY